MNYYCFNILLQINYKIILFGEKNMFHLTRFDQLLHHLQFRLIHFTCIEFYDHLQIQIVALAAS